MLNASRHHRKNRPPSRDGPSPSGISAQRLAASPEKSQGRRYDGTRCRQCSTPRGITGKIADDLIGDCGENLQRCSTPRGITGKIAVPLSRWTYSWKSAQRLAASPEKSRSGPCSAECPARRAQRLAASPEKSPTAESLRSVSAGVLNASRHHRKNRCLRASKKCRPSTVLNASRHHRKNRHEF